MKKKKYVALVIVTIIVSIIALIGATYALLTATIQGDKKITLKAGLLKVDFEEGNAINLDNAEPMSDSRGLKTSPYTFTITNTGTIEAYYYVSLENDVNNTLNEDLVKMRLTNDQGYDSGVVRVSDYAQSSYQITEEGKLNVDDKVTYNLWLWLDNNADNTAQGKEYKSKIVVSSFDRPQNVKSVSDVIVDNLGDSGSTYDDGTDTFITGIDPNNYIWYSGKLWRAVSINNEAKTTKLVTQWNISAISYNPENNTAFEGSFMEDWLNDTSVDGFLGNLREPENFIVMDAKWDATRDAANLGSIQRPNGTTVVTDAVGLLNIYEYQSSNNGGTDGYLNNGAMWWTLTPYSTSDVRRVIYYGDVFNDSPADAYGVRPSINLKSSVKIVDGDGTIDNPYRLNGDNDTNLSRTLLSTRYSGEYIKFGNDENNLYRIVSHENGTGTKITSAEPLKSSGTFIESEFGNTAIFSSTNTIGAFLNGTYLTNYLDSEYSNMIEDSTTWYLGTVGDGASYKLAKYIDTSMTSTTTSTTSAKVGLLRMGELMAGQFDRSENNIAYSILTPSSSVGIRFVSNYGYSYGDKSPSMANKVRPSMNLKSNVIITSGDGTKYNPFTVELGS